MNTRILWTLLLLTAFACKDDDVYTEITPVPEDVFNLELCPTLVSNVTALFPESGNNAERHSQLFSSGVQQRIVLTKDADVYVSFVSEAATIGNVLGYYVYNSGSTPGSSSDIDKQLIFPNVDNTYLKPGDTRRLGSTQLKAGTVVGFFLIVGGYRGDGIYFKNPTFYTDHSWNTDGARQHVLYRESECGAIVIGFEDKRSGNGDQDFNDIIFSVSDNISDLETTSFNIEGIPTLSN